MKSFWNFIKDNRLYTFINLFGLTVSMAFVLLLAVYVSRQLTTDSFHKNADRIYIYANENYIDSPYYLQKYLIENFPEIEKTTSLCSYNVIGSLSIGETTLQTTKTSYADSSFFDIFSFRLIEGSNEAWKASDRSAVISESFADTYFSDRDPIGQSLKYTSQNGDTYTYTVAAVMEDIDHSVIPYCDVLCRAEVLPEANPSNDEQMSNAVAVETFIMTWPGADIQAKIPDIRELLGEIWWVYSQNQWDKVFFIPLREVYFYDKAHSMMGNILQGDRQLVNILMAACIILTLFAVLNYINLTVAQSGRRAKEMATRRLLGSSKNGIRWRMIAEATVFAAVSAVLAIVTAEALSPSASRLLEYDFSVWKEMTPAIAAMIAAGIAVLGLLSGTVPAMVISRAEPIDIVRGSFNLKVRSWYGKVLIVLQQVVAVIMIAISLTMYFQIRDMIRAPLNYNTEDILNVSNSIFTSEGQIGAFRDAVETLPCVASAGFGDGIPLTGTNNWTMPYKDGMISFQMIQGDSAYFNILGLRVKHDNRLDDRNIYFWNEYAFREVGLPETATEALFGTEDAGTYTIRIGGVYHDFKINPLLYDQSAALIKKYDVYPSDMIPWNTIIKVKGNHKEAYDRICEIYGDICPGGLFDASFIEDQVAATFSEYTRLQKIIIIFTAIAIFVSALGLFAMSTYYIRCRSRNIAVQKVFGADRNLILRQTTMTYLILSGIAFVISVPASSFLTSKWLEQFSYRMDQWIPWIIILASGLLACLIAFLAVLYQSIQAVKTDPVNALRKDD